MFLRKYRVSQKSPSPVMINAKNTLLRKRISPPERYKTPNPLKEQQVKTAAISTEDMVTSTLFTKFSSILLFWGIFVEINTSTNRNQNTPKTSCLGIKKNKRMGDKYICYPKTSNLNVHLDFLLEFYLCGVYIPSIFPCGVHLHSSVFGSNSTLLSIPRQSVSHFHFVVYIELPFLSALHITFWPEKAVARGQCQTGDNFPTPLPFSIEHEA
ncbi:hypothetical protein NQ317_002650 [Molorchus minor]|uniref:Uncharacterized protein n=1 Tax=Molorchus minor TaxID=1323400 RepID=A0ABQ9IR95_9CUCU|nr:hypothetical protein NQ317_002650 [Molorchus minor]